MVKRILVVVDVQKAYAPHFSEDYVASLKAYVEDLQWDEVIVRFIGEDEYTVTAENGEHLHHFGNESRHIPNFLKERATSFSERWFGYSWENYDDVEELVEDKLYRVSDNDETWYMSETPNGDSYCPTREIEVLLDTPAEIHIVGGFEDQCVKEVFDFLSLAGAKNVQIDSKYCFTTVPPNVEKALHFTKEWVEPDPLLVK